MEHGCQSKPANSRWHRRQGCEGRWHFSRAPGTPGRGPAWVKARRLEKHRGVNWLRTGHPEAPYQSSPGPVNIRKGAKPHSPLCVTLSQRCPVGPGLVFPGLRRAEIQQGQPG